MTRSGTLQRILGPLTHEYVLYALAASVFVGMYYARAAVSIATGLLAIITVLTLLSGNRRKAISSDQATLRLTLVYLIYVLSGINSSNSSMWFEVLRINVPYLIIPIGLWAFGPLSRIQYSRLFMIFIAITSISAAIMLGDYILHFSEYTARYEVGKTIPTPIRHVRYSFFMAIAALLALGLLLDRVVQERIQKYLLTGAAVLLIAALHVLAVRTGLITLYGGILALLAGMVIRERRWKEAGILVATGAILAFAAIRFVPSLSNKMDYMLHDLAQMRDGGMNANYSDNIRLVSIRHGLEIFRENPVFGTGVGDIKDEMYKKYAELTPKMPEEHRYSPISQFVYWLSALGVVGTLLFLFLVLAPLYLNWRHSYILIALYAGVFTSLIGETSIQLQLGKTLFLFVVCITLGFRRWQVMRQPVDTANSPA